MRNIFGTYTEKKYWIVVNSDGTILKGDLEVGQFLHIGNRVAELFSSEEDFNNRLVELEDERTV